MRLNVDTQVRLAGTRSGRVILHLLALVVDHKVGWHLAGILREIHRH